MSNRFRREITYYAVLSSVLALLFIVNQKHRTALGSAVLLVWFIAVGVWTGSLIQRWINRNGNGGPTSG